MVVLNWWSGQLLGIVCESGVVQVFRGGGLARLIDFIEPLAQVDHLAAVRAKRAMRRILRRHYAYDLLTGGTLIAVQFAPALPTGLLKMVA